VTSDPGTNKRVGAVEGSMTDAAVVDAPSTRPARASGFRRLIWVAFVVGLVALGIGLALVTIDALVAGDWWLAREPWIGFGLTAIVVGLALLGVFGAALVLLEPVGRWRLLALPPAIVVGFWWMVIGIGLPTTGLGGPERDPRTILYTLPDVLIVLVVATLAMASPLLKRRR
jgi:vacuolar-type H+-ATPase subunit I/STV1